MKLFILALTLGLLLCPSFRVNANDVEGFNITQRLTTGEVEHTNRRIRFLSANPGEFWDNYQKAHADLNFWERLASGILQIDDILNYMTFLVGFLSQLGMVVGVILIMYAGYKYMLSVFNGGKVPTSTLKNAIIGVIIIIFSYAIMRILISIIGLA